MENADDQFSLKWNNFQSNLATGFHDLLQEEDMVDVTIAAEGKFVQAHKIILSVCSPYFKDLFKVNPCKHPIVILKDVGHQELSDMLDFMYRGEASVRQEDLSAFLKLAETLKVKGLAGDKPVDDMTAAVQAQAQVQQQSTPRKPVLAVKKKRIVEQTVFDPDDDPADEEYTATPVQSEPKRKRRRPSSPPHYKTESSPASAVSTYVPVALPSPKREVITEEEDVEFLEDNSADPMAEYMAKNKSAAVDFDDSNLDMTTGDDGQDDTGDLSGHLAGPSNAGDSTDLVPPGDEVERPTIYLFYDRTPECDLARCTTCARILKTPNRSSRSLYRHLRKLHPDQWQLFEDRKMLFAAHIAAADL